jgi:long-subunit fatty acid transport protein
VGASATILFGSSDDVEQRVERGLLTFFYDKFRSDSLYDRTTRTGTSSYSGVIPALGGVLRQEAFTLGVSVRLPMTLTREWDRTVVRDTAGTVTTTTEAGTDKLELPVAVSLGGVLHPSPDVDVALDYRIGNNGNVTYTPSGGSSLQPWLSSQELRAGVEFRATTWLALRGGFRQVSAPFAGAGAPLLDEPESGQAYSAGVGLGLADLRFDLAYEYASLKYEDAWQSNVNYNTRQTNTIWFETAYRF